MLAETSGEYLEFWLPDRLPADDLLTLAQLFEHLAAQSPYKTIEPPDFSGMFGL